MLVDIHRHLRHDRGCQTNYRSQKEPMDATWIITAFIVIDALMKRLWGIAHPQPSRVRGNWEVRTFLIRRF